MTERVPISSTEHEHGWDCFRTSGGYTTAMEKDGGTWAEKVERIYKTAYATGFKNGKRRVATVIEAATRAEKYGRTAYGGQFKWLEPLAAALAELENSNVE